MENAHTTEILTAAAAKLNEEVDPSCADQPEIDVKQVSLYPE